MRVTLAGIPAGAAENDVRLLVQDHGSRQRVLAIGQENRAAGRKPVDRREQFVRRANADHFAPGGGSGGTFRNQDGTVWAAVSQRG